MKLVPKFFNVGSQEDVRVLRQNLGKLEPLLETDVDYQSGMPVEVWFDGIRGSSVYPSGTLPSAYEFTTPANPSDDQVQAYIEAGSRSVIFRIGGDKGDDLPYRKFELHYKPRDKNKSE